MNYSGFSRLRTDQNSVQRQIKVLEVKLWNEWIAENEAGNPRYRELMQRDLNHPIERVGNTLRERMAWLKRQAAA